MRGEWGGVREGTKREEEKQRKMATNQDKSLLPIHQARALTIFPTLLGPVDTVSLFHVIKAAVKISHVYLYLWALRYMNVFDL